MDCSLPFVAFPCFFSTSGSLCGCPGGTGERTASLQLKGKSGRSPLLAVQQLRDSRQFTKVHLAGKGPQREAHMSAGSVGATSLHTSSRGDSGSTSIPLTSLLCTEPALSPAPKETTVTPLEVRAATPD